MTRRSRSPTIRAPAPSPWSISRSRSASSRSIGSQRDGSEAERMLVWSRSGRFIVWLLAALLIGIIFIAPLAVILAASLAKQWNGVLPTGFTFEHYASAASGASGDSVLASLITGLVAVFSRL